ncbi:hypothetical protein LIP_2499 [Limnochorda pilosa]|uniref:Uncharacterized protein n=1 Tax=Limnochorda pilosa TaxID=1555112 RepID=A0A0K2SMK1_LIMPI|nr:hypothetical protein LIP_2499 [Limnochorda pilosa]
MAATATRATPYQGRFQANPSGMLPRSSIQGTKVTPTSIAHRLTVATTLLASRGRPSPDRTDSKLRREVTFTLLRVARAAPGCPRARQPAPGTPENGKPVLEPFLARP